MKRSLTLIFAAALIAAPAVAQTTSPDSTILKRIERLEQQTTLQSRLKISGYVQGQFQWGEENASMKVGSGNEREGSFNRFGVRRGRLKFTYTHGLGSAVFQLDMTEKGVGFKDVYFNIRDPWVGSMALRAGIFDRPFGYEISYSSSRRESPERSAIFQDLFPDERDLGAMLVLQAPKSSPWSILKLEAGLFAGNGIKQETDSRKDFIGHLSLAKSWGDFTLGAGASYYHGSVYQGSSKVYEMSGNSFVENDDAGNIGGYAKRQYFGFDAQLSFTSSIGKTQLRGEYLFGQQPGTDKRTKSPNSSDRAIENTFIRDFSGGYVMLVQSLGTLPVSVVGKYDWYDPNTDVSGDAIGALASNTSEVDLSKNTLGVGALWDLNSAVRLQAYYEFVNNEKSKQLLGYDTNVKDDLFTLRLQYKF